MYAFGHLCACADSTMRFSRFHSFWLMISLVKNTKSFFVCVWQNINDKSMGEWEWAEHAFYVFTFTYFNFLLLKMCSRVSFVWWMKSDPFACRTFQKIELECMTCLFHCTSNTFPSISFHVFFPSGKSLSSSSNKLHTFARRFCRHYYESIKKTQTQSVSA